MFGALAESFQSIFDDSLTTPWLAQTREKILQIQALFSEEALTDAIAYIQEFPDTYFSLKGLRNRHMQQSEIFLKKKRIHTPTNDCLLDFPSYKLSTHQGPYSSEAVSEDTHKG